MTAKKTKKAAETLIVWGRQDQPMGSQRRWGGEIGEASFSDVQQVGPRLATDSLARRGPDGDWETDDKIWMLTLTGGKLSTLEDDSAVIGFSRQETRRSNPVETSTDSPKPKKDAGFPWTGVALGAAGLLGFYYLFLRPKAEAAVVGPPATMPVAPQPPALPVVTTPPIAAAVVTVPATTTSPTSPVPVMPVEPPAPIPGSIVNPATGALIPLGRKFAAWAAFPDPATTWRWELGPMLDAYQALFPGNVVDGGIARLPASSASQICILAQSVPFYTLNASDYAAAVFFLNPTDTLDEVVLTTTVQCAQSIASMLAQRGIRPVFTLVDGDDTEGTLKAAIAPVGGVVVTVPRTGVTSDAVYEAGARAVHLALYGVGRGEGRA